MAMEPTNSSDSSVTFLALIVGALVVLVALMFAGGALELPKPAENKTTISIDAPASNPAPATAPSGN